MPKPAKIYLRKNKRFGASCDGTADTGHFIATIGGRFTVWSIRDEDKCICARGTREEAEQAIAADWRAAS